MPRHRNARFIIAGILFALLGFQVVSSIVDALILQNVPTATAFFISDAIKWSIVLALFGYVLFIEKRTLTTAFNVQRPSYHDVLIGVIGGVFLLLLSVLVAVYSEALLGIQTGNGMLDKLFHLSFGQRLLLVLTAAVTEELLYRSYPIERLIDLTGSKVLAGSVTFTAFLLAHVPAWGFETFIQQGVVAFGLTIVYLYRRNVWVCIFMHGVLDAIVLLLIPSLGH